MRLASLLGRILASTALAACGGQVAGTDAPGSGPGPSPTSTTTSTTPTKPPPADAGTDSAIDAGCTSPPKLVREGKSCGDVWYSACGIPAGVDPSDGMTDAECAKVCGTKPDTKYWGCAPYLPADLPAPSFECYTCVEGRRPQGYFDPISVPTIAGWLAHAADLERVSVDAFQILRRELGAHGAPRGLVERAAAAETDEMHHTRILSELARAEGAKLEDEPILHGAVRSLFEIALENAVEGCVRETYGALVAGYQAIHASRDEIRRAMRRIYADETAHAELAWDIHAWIVDKLTPQEQRTVEDAMRRAARELRVAAGRPVPDTLVDELGLPGIEDGERLVAGLMDDLFAPSRAA